MKPKSSHRSFLLACGSLLASSVAHAEVFTWTQTATGSQDWTVGANWNANPLLGGTGQFVSDSGNELRFFADNTTSIPTTTTQTIVSVPSMLSMNTLTLNGRGPNSTLGFPIIIGDSNSTWTIGDDTTSTVNLNSALGGGTSDRDVRYTIAANLELRGGTSGITTFTGNSGSVTGAVFSGNITQTGTGKGITKSGSSLLIFSGNNSYTGTTLVSAGTLRLNSATALSGGLGATGGTSALTISGTGVVELGAGNFQRNLGTGSSQFQITGGTSGFSALGGPRAITVNGNASQEVVWGSASFAPTTLVLNAATADSALTFSNKIDLNGATRTVQVNASGAVLANDIRSSSGTAGITKTGNGTLYLTGANTYTGATTISGGTLSVGAANNLGGASADLVMNSGTLQIIGTTLTSISGLGRTVTFNSGNKGFEINNANNTFTVNQVLNQGTGALTKSGVGTLVLNQDNTYTGATTATGGGTLVLDYSTNNGSKLGNSAALNLNGSNLVLRGGSHAEAIGSIVLAANTGNAISRDGSSAATIANAGVLTTNGNSNLTISEAGIVSTTTANHTSGIQTLGRVTVGSNFATKDGSNLLQAYSIPGGDSYTAGAGGGSGTVVNQLTGGGNMTGTLTSYALRLANSGNSDVLELGSNNLNFAIGGTLLYAGGSDNNYTINGTGGVRTFNGNQPMNVNVFTGTLTVNALLAANGSSTLTKAGAGTLVAGGTNTYTSATYVQQGVLRLTNSSGLGGTNTGTFVQGGAALELSNGISVGAEALTIDGAGISNGGALRNHSGTNSYAGAISLGASGARINSDASTSLELTGGVQTTYGSDVTFGGAGSTTVSTTAISGAGSIIKDGAGTLTLSAANTYTGTTKVSAGTLAVNGSITNDSGVTVNDTGILQGSGTINSSVAILSGGTLASGNSIESLAVGSLSLQALATFAYEMNNDAASNVAGDLTGVTGNLNLDLGNTSILTLSELGAGSWADAEKLTLISYSGLWNGGLFNYGGNVLADDSTFNFSGIDWIINYNDTVAGMNYTSDLTGPGFVTITAGAIPEPSVALLGGLGALLLLHRRRS